MFYGVLTNRRRCEVEMHLYHLLFYILFLPPRSLIPSLLLVHKPSSSSTSCTSYGSSFLFERKKMKGVLLILNLSFFLRLQRSLEKPIPIQTDELFLFPSLSSSFCPTTFVIFLFISPFFCLPATFSSMLEEGEW